MMNVYLDHASAEPINENVLKNIKDKASLFFNPSASNNFSNYNYSFIEKARELVARMINADPEEIYFTSGASESNAWGVDGFLKRNPEYKAVSSNIEHSSILNNPNVESCIKVDKDGRIQKEALDVLDKNKYLFVIGHGNNEIGVIQDLSLIKSDFPDSFLFVDASQTFGKIPIDVKAMNVDMLSCSGGKVGALRGTGFLYINKKVDVAPIIYGTQERGMRGGTYFDLGIWSLYVALLDVDVADQMRSVRAKRNYLLDLLSECEQIHLIGKVENRLPNNILIKVSDVNIDSQQIMGLLENNGYIVSSGSACHAYEQSISHVLQAIGETDESARTVLRITIGKDSDVNDLKRFANCLKQIISEFKSK